MKTLDDLELSRTEIEFIIDEYIFNERDRQIMKRRLLDGVIFDRLGEEFDMDSDSVRNIYYKHRSKILRMATKVYGK